MDYPYKYFVVVSDEDSYSSSEQYYKYVDIADALKKVDSCKANNSKVCLYRINQHFGYN